VQSLVETVTAVANTGATTQDVTISSFGTVVGCFGNLSLGVTDGTAVSHGVISTGIWDGTNTRGKSFYSENAQSGTDTYQVKRNDRFFVVLDGTGAVVAYATLSAVSNGVKVSWFNSAGTATAPPTAWIMNFQFYGGSAAQAKIVDVTGPTISTVVTTVGFQADALIGIGPGSFGTAGSAAPSEMILWYATRAPSIKNAGLIWSDPDNLATSAPTLWASETWCLTEGSGDTGSVTAFSSNGFTLTNAVQNNALPNTAVLALKLPGIDLWCGAISSPTSGGVTTHTEPGIKMQAALLGLTGVTALDTTATDDTASAFGISMIGGRTGTPVERFAIARERDAQTTTSTGSLAAAKVVRMLVGAGTTLYTGNWDTAWPAVGISINWTSTNATARKLIMLAFGVEAIQPSGIATSEAFGTPALTPGAVTLSPGGIASAEAFGTPALSARITVSPSGVASAEAFGNPTLTPGAVTVSPSGIASAEAFGTPALAASITISPSGVASAEAFGTPALSATITVDLNNQGIPSDEAFGTPALAASITVSPSGIASAEAFGTPTLTPGAVTIDLDTQGVPSAEAFGTPTLTPGAVTIDLDTQGIPSAEAFGTPALAASITIDLDTQGIASAEAFGTPALAATVTISPSGIASAEAFGTPTLSVVGAQVIDLDGQGISSAEAFGTPLLIGTGTQIIQPSGIPSAEAFGYPFLRGGFIAVTLKKKVHDALCQAAQLGTFIEANYDADACELVQGLQVQPASVEVNELTAAYATLHRLGRKYVLDPTSWQWLLILKFNEEVICEPFVRALLEDPICIPRDENEDRQVTVKLVDTQYEHPPREGASNGTQARFRFQAELSPR
jgi:hypothetical protein